MNQLRREVTGRFEFDNIVGKSPQMREIFNLVELAAASPVTVLITGETGTGKEVVAKAIHYHSERKNGPLVRVNCSALSESLLESELFGHAWRVHRRHPGPRPSLNAPTAAPSFPMRSATSPRCPGEAVARAQERESSSASANPFPKSMRV